MASPFDIADAVAQAAIDAQFGEAITIHPMIGDEYSAAIDPDRAEWATRGVFSKAPTSLPIEYPATRRPGARVAVGVAELWITADIAGLIPYDLRRRDVVELEAGRYIMGDPEISDQGDLRIALTPAGTP